MQIRYLLYLLWKLSVSTTRLLSPPGSSTFVDLLGPPVEAGGRADAFGLALERGAVGQLGVLEVLDAWRNGG